MEDKVVVYSDGGCRPNPGIGGWAALLIFGEHQREISGGAKNVTNNQMELTAAIEALNALTRPCDVDFYTDSQYVKKGISEWITKWRKNGWLTADKKPVMNQDLWQRLYELTQLHTIHWKWTRGHAGNPYNERVDELATQARQQVQNSR